MSIDLYALCPCGSGKKVKFCCADLVPELEKVQRMLDGNQRHAALDHVDKLLASHPGRPALMALRVGLQQSLGMVEQGHKTIREFFELHPTNPIALSEMAILQAAEGGAVAGVELLQKALAESEQHVAPQVADAMIDMAQLLLADGHFQAALAHALLSLRLHGENEVALDMLTRMNSSAQVPLLLKDERPFAPAPPDAPYKAEFDATMSMARGVQWLDAERRLTALAQRGGDAPAVWQNLATLRGWLANDAGETEALRKFGALRGTREEAVEAEATAQLVDPKQGEDVVDQVRLTYPVNDVDRLIEAGSGDKRLITYPVEAVRRAEGEVPPRAVYILLDRAMPSTGVDITFDAVPSIIGQALVFGRETDREPRLEMQTNRRDLEAAQTLLNDLWRDVLGPAGEEEVIGHLPARQMIFNWNWRLPEDTPPEHVQQLLIRKRRDTILNRWPKTPNALFDNKTPEDVAADPAQRLKLLGALLLIELSLEHPSADGLINELRARLGLPTLHPIDPKGLDLEALPLVRLSRLIVENLTDDELLVVYRRALFVGARAALRKFSNAVVGRPEIVSKIDLSSVYANLANLEEDGAKALEYLGKARSTAAAAGKSCARWDISELAMRLERGDENGASALLHHIQSRHANEPGVGEALMQMLYAAGLIGADGRPVAGPGAAAPASPGLVVPGAAAASSESSRIWTPGSEAPAASGKSSALWTPGM